MYLRKVYVKGIQNKNTVHNFDRLIFQYFSQLIFKLTPLTSAAKGTQRLVNQKLCNTDLILDDLLLSICLSNLLI